MSHTQVIIQIAKASLYDQIRRDKFFLILFATLALIVAAVPPPQAEHALLTLGQYRLFYNSAWIGTFVAVFTSIILALPGFYLVRGTIRKDKIIAIDGVYASTNTGRVSYLLGKFIGNLGVLLCIAFSAIITAVILQLKYGEEPYIHLWTLLTPFFLITVPCLLAVAALSIIFDTARGLTGIIGNFLYLGLWVGAIMLSLYPSHDSKYFVADTKNDILGISSAMTSVVTTVKEQHGEYNGQIYFGVAKKDLNVISQPVLWEGLEWSWKELEPRLILVGGSFFLMVLSGLMFFRFDPAHEPKRRVASLARARGSYSNEEVNLIFPVVQKYLTPILSFQLRQRFKIMFIAESKRLFKETAWWWFLAMALLNIVCVFAPFDIMHEWLLPTVWIWPLFVWSKLGMRVSKHFRTSNKNFDAQRDALFMPVLWVLGVLITMTAGSGVAVRLILAGEWSALYPWIISAAFIPSLAFVLSIWTASNYVFEGSYVLLWLVSCLSKQPLLDFMGTLQDSIVVKNPFLYLLGTVALITFAAVGKQRLIEK